jgi:hypothetical protein
VSRSPAKPVRIIAQERLPPGFGYPESYKAFAAQAGGAIGPAHEAWVFLGDDELDDALAHIARIAGERPLVPFMRREGDDVLACFDGCASAGEEARVFLLRFGSNPGFGGGRRRFAEWLALVCGHGRGEPATNAGAGPNPS